MLFNPAPLAVKTTPAEAYINLNWSAEAPTVQIAVTTERPPAAYPPCAVISATTDEKIEMPDNEVIVPDAELRWSDILKTPVCRVNEPLPIFFFAAA